MRWQLAKTWLAAVVACAATGVRANDASFGGRGADVVPLRDSRVRIVREEVVLELSGNPRTWSVNAAYELENPTDTPVVLQLGFPEAHCARGQDRCASGAGRFRDLRTSVRGRPVRHRVAAVSPDTDAEWMPSVGRVFLYDVTFGPHERLAIAHSYRLGRSFSSEGEIVSYVTRTGAAWAEPIERARFVVRVPARSWALAYPRDYRWVRDDERMEHGRVVDEIVFENERWRPQEDLLVILGRRGALAPDDRSAACPLPEDGSGSHVPLRRRVEPLDDATLAWCADLVRARHGAPLADAEHAAELYAPASYDAERLAMVVGHRPNPSWDEALLTARERAVLAAITREQTSRRLRRAPAAGPIGAVETARPPIVGSASPRRHRSRGRLANR